ncbi:hypothetical protein DITRI_Ditri16bG0008600 [Diplodiscus trichospermus]
METPSSARRLTRSQTLAALNNNLSVSKGKNEDDSEKSVSKTRARNGKQQQERCALIDITNDSPIVGLAVETPSSAKQRNSRAENMVMMMMTPGSGEALLRGCVNSPMGLLAPTPSNTPQVSNLSEDGGIDNGGLGSIVLALPVVEEQLEDF